MIWQSASGALTAALTLIAQRFASRLVGDEELPTDVPRGPEGPDPKAGPRPIRARRDTAR